MALDPPAADAPDWRRADAYAPLLRAAPALLAWEWLRRDQAYRAAALAALDGAPGGGLPDGGHRAAERWGLHAFEHPGRAVPSARPVWSARANAFVLAARARPDDGLVAPFDLARVRDYARLVRAGRADRLLLSDGFAALRLDVTGHPLGRGPVALSWRLAGMAGLGPPLAVLARLLAFWAAGRFAPARARPGGRPQREILLLRARDGLAAGASQRDLAEALFSAEAGRPRWRVETASLRSRAQRLARAARAMGGGGYLRLLGPAAGP